jgi:hypothetical protein
MLRTGLAGCFIGHGAFGIITKAAWVPYFAVGGISEPMAWKWMPVIGTMDVLVGAMALWRPCRALFVWATLWTIWTALLRPFSGEPFWEAVERAGNYGVPLSILLIVGLQRPWFARLPDDWTSFLPQARPRLAWALRLTTCAILAGHAGLGFFSLKAGLARHYAAIGALHPNSLVPLIGGFEFFLAGCVLVFPHPSVLLIVCGWKIATESLFLVSGAPIWEVIERLGDYIAPLTLAYLLLSYPLARRANPDQLSSA